MKNPFLRLKAVLPFFTFVPIFFFQLFRSLTWVELIELREWIFASKRILKNISQSSSLAKYRNESERGQRFSELTQKKLSEMGPKGLGVIANNEYLTGGGYRSSSIVALKKFLAYESSRGDSAILDEDLIFFGPEWASAIGHSSYLSIIPKLSFDETHSSQRRILIYSHAANNFYLSLFASQYILCKLPESLRSVLVNYLEDYLHPLDTFRINSTKVSDLYSALTQSERKWNAAMGERSFLHLPERAFIAGQEFLKKAKLENFEWFVALHMREAPTTPARDVGNVEVETYIPAIREVLRSGGAVIRLGNPGMTRLEKFDSTLSEDSGYFDYANSPFKSEILDIFLMSTCRFMIGTASGPLHVLKDFGKSVLYTNAPKVGMLPGVRGYCLPILYKNSSMEILTLSEMLSYDEIGWRYSTLRSEFSMVKNSKEDILVATQFMLEGGYRIDFQGRDDSLNDAANKIRKPYEASSAMPICPTYLSSHAKLLV
jgi:putative glycosyltransferase (TIGR04372 family)